jgi:hypothetical protein
VVAGAAEDVDELEELDEEVLLDEDELSDDDDVDEDVSPFFSDVPDFSALSVDEELLEPDPDRLSVL